MKLKSLVAALPAFFAPAAALANECIPNMIGFDVCEFAQETQKLLAPSLPMQLSGEMSFQQIMAAGPLLSAVVVWNYDKSDLDRLLESNGISNAAFVERMEEMTSRMACGLEQFEAFVGLGGRVQYIYRTLDAYPVHSITVESC